jgi:O-antigen/teichoic acid export membrane protein
VEQAAAGRRFAHHYTFRTITEYPIASGGTLRLRALSGLLLSRLVKSQSIRAAVIFAAGGFGFAAGNVVLAMVLPPATFGVIALLLALNQFGLTLGSLGMEVIVNRHRPLLDRDFAINLLVPAVCTAALMAATAHYFYELTPGIAALAFILIVASTVNRVVAGLFQEERQFLSAMALLQIHNYTLLIAAGLVVLFALPNATLVTALIAVSYLCSAAVGWWRASTTMTSGRVVVSIRLLLSEGISVVGLNLAVQFLFQFERLAIPKVGSMTMLATYAVLAAIAGSPYRMIQLGNSFTLLPRIRSARDAVAARKVISHEFITAALVALLSTVALIVFAPAVFHYVLHDRYVIGWALLSVAIAMGMVRVWEGFSTTVVSALGTPRRLAQLSVVSWVSLGVALVGVVVGSRYGLVGVLYGTMAAWIVLAIGGTWLAQISFRERFASVEPALSS